MLATLTSVGQHQGLAYQQSPGCSFKAAPWFGLGRSLGRNGDAKSLTGRGQTIDLGGIIDQHGAEHVVVTDQ